MKVPRRALYLIALALAGAIAVCAFVRRGVDTDLLGMVGTGSGEASALADLRALSADAVHVLCADSARAEALRARYPFDPSVDQTAFLETVRTKGRGLLAPKTRALLEQGAFDRVRRGVMRRDYTGVGLFSKADDPNYFLGDFAAAFAALEPQNLPEGGVILTGRGAAIDAAVPTGGLLTLAREAAADDGLWLSGAPFHAAIARQATVREVNILGAVSLAAVMLFGWLLFRSFRFVLPMAGAIACGLLAATGAVCLLPGRPHALAFLFGTTLIGLGVDYCYHALAPERAAPDFVRRLTGALLTTCAAFAPLLGSSVSVLRQMAVFSIVGLVAIYLFVRLFVPADPAAAGALPRAAVPRRLPRAFVLLLVPAALAAAVFCRPQLSSDPSLFHRPAPVMARGEAKFAALSGGSGRLRVVNLTRWQAENAALKAKFGEPPKGGFLTAADLPAGLAFSRGGADFLVLPDYAADAIVGTAGETVDLKALLADVFARFLSEASLQATLALALLLAVALFLFRWRAFAVFAPPVGAVILTYLSLGAMGEPVTFFHILCFFVLVGLGIDYAIFHRLGDRPRDDFSKRVVFYSFLTSLVGFGLLGVTSFPVTRGMGLTLAVGLFWAYVFSLPRGDRPVRTRGDRPVEAMAWHEQKEQSAGRLRILVMWYLYRFLGKNVAKILFLFAYVFIYPFCRAARAALRPYYEILGVKGRPFRHILSFAWSIFDKTDACTLCKNPPRFTLAGDTGWMKGGCFLLSTHLGCIEVLPALRKTWGQTPSTRGRTPRVHAFQQMGHDAVFTQVFAARLDAAQLTLHAVEDIGVETAVEMSEAIRAGEIVLMAGDRLSAAAGGRTAGRGGRKAQFRHRFLGRECAWPKGVFRFAELMGCPLYAIICVKTGWNAYEIKAVRLGTDPLGEYVAFLEENVRQYPYQWYQFYRFFSEADTGGETWADGRASR